MLSVTKPENDPTTLLGASNLRHRLLQLIRYSTGISRAKSNESNSLTPDTESPTGVIPRKSLTDDPSVADLNWDHELLLMKGAYEERGTPYHYCLDDSQRKINGIPMNQHCQMLCVGPGPLIGQEQQYAIVTCGFNQRCCDNQTTWGKPGNHPASPSIKERRLVLNEAFTNVQRDFKGVCAPLIKLKSAEYFKSPYFAIGAPVKWKVQKKWLSGKVIAHYPGDDVLMPYLVREEVQEKDGTFNGHRLLYVLNDEELLKDRDNHAIINTIINPNPSSSRSAIGILPMLKSASAPLITTMADVTFTTHSERCKPPSPLHKSFANDDAYPSIHPSIRPSTSDKLKARSRSMSLTPPTINENVCYNRPVTPISRSSAPASTPVRSRTSTLTPTSRRNSFLLPPVHGNSVRENIRVRRERILVGDSGKSTDDETTVDIDQLMIDYLSETDEETDEEREERKLDEGMVRKQKAEDGVANALARKALEEF